MCSSCSPLNPFLIYSVQRTVLIYDELLANQSPDDINHMLLKQGHFNEHSKSTLKGPTFKLLSSFPWQLWTFFQILSSTRWRCFRVQEETTSLNQTYDPSSSKALADRGCSARRHKLAAEGQPSAGCELKSRSGSVELRQQQALVPAPDQWPSGKDKLRSQALGASWKPRQ